ncbi:hypothetical protein PENSPDRAFT_685058 [Peniophora sp. CONT]|nr:hypothetical protein PENSPDRAFT_685058 [Peniophora sp. CONT]
MDGFDVMFGHEFEFSGSGTTLYIEDAPEQPQLVFYDPAVCPMHIVYPSLPKTPEQRAALRESDYSQYLDDLSDEEYYALEMAGELSDDEEDSEAADDEAGDDESVEGEDGMSEETGVEEVE